MFLAFYALEYESSNADGKFSGVWVSGNLVMTMLVIVSNMKILVSSFLIEGVIIFCVFGSVSFFFLIFWLESESTSSIQYGTLPMLMGEA